MAAGGSAASAADCGIFSVHGIDEGRVQHAGPFSCGLALCVQMAAGATIFLGPFARRRILRATSGVLRIRRSLSYRVRPATRLNLTIPD